jgi:NodT family efflux transporter outer membrane factor (OMF) lipoprotein
MLIYRLLAISLVINILFFQYPVFSKQNNQTESSINLQKNLKGTVYDYRDEFINKSWWERFNDPVLIDYILKTSYANNDLKSAGLRVSESSALVMESLGKEFPVVVAGADYQRNKTSDNISMGSFKLPSYTQNTFNLPFMVNYELDLWQKNRLKTIGVTKQLEAARYDERAAYISLTSAVAAVYFNSIKSDKLIEIQKQLVDLKIVQSELVKEKYENGLCPLSEYLTAKKLLLESENTLSDFTKQRGILLNHLAVLTGESVDSVMGLKRSNIDDIDVLKDIPVFLKSDIVKRRPDILKAEALLQKYKIDTELARKDFLPTIDITGQFGFLSNSFAKTFEWDSYTASFGTGMMQTVFSGGQKRARLRAKKFQYEQMLENYQKVLLQSFQEVNDSLAVFKFDNDKLSNNKDRMIFEKDNMDLIDAKFESGAISYLDTLEYKIKLLIIEKELVQSKADCLIDLLSLYKASGGQL